MDELKTEPKSEQKAEQSNGAVSEAGEGQGGFNTAHFIKFVFLFLIFITAGFLILVGRAWYQSYQEKQESAERVRQAIEMEQRYIDAMTQDTYGGKTPEETLKLFIEALRAEDVELAAKYFMLDEDLSREKWVEFLLKVQNEGNLDRFASDLTQKAKRGNDFTDIRTAFVMMNDDGTVGFQMDMFLIRSNGIWKIERM